MTTNSPDSRRHCWALPAAESSSTGALPPSPESYLDIRCHRRLRGPYTAGGTLLRHVVPELLPSHADLLVARTIEITAIAPELVPLIPAQPQTLTDNANPVERTRFYAAARTKRIAHGVSELLMDWARALHPAGVVIELREVDEADPTDAELVQVLLRRCDPRVLSLVVHAGQTPADDQLAKALTSYARPVARRYDTQVPPPGADLAQLFIDSDGTSRDPALLAAYGDLEPAERARRHTARADALAALGEPTLRLGAIPYHLERGTDPAEAGGRAIVVAHNDCYDRGFYEAALDLAMRGRQVISIADRPKWYWSLTQKASSCLCYLERGQEAFDFLAGIRRDCIDPESHMNSCYQMAMLYTRHLPKSEHDHERALEWANIAIVIADRHPDQKKQVFFGAFMRNARALVDLHRGDRDRAMALVTEAIAMTDAELGSDEHMLHRSVLVYNRAQLLAAAGDHAASLTDYDEVISRDPDYGDYYFERATEHRAVGNYDEALADYSTAIRLSLPFHEAHFNRADLLREMGDGDGALADLDYAAALKPVHLETLINRADLLIERGELDRARADIEQGLAADPRNVHLLCASGSLLAETGDTRAAYAAYTAAIAEDPEFAAAWANRAVLAYASGRPQDAVDDLDRAIELADDPELRANRAVAFAELGDHSAAVADLDIAVAVSNGDAPELLYRRGASRLALGDTDGALADWRAHLAAYDQDGYSPYASEIMLRAGGLPGGHRSSAAQLPEGVA